jgi:hypothetical protein
VDVYGWETGYLGTLFAVITSAFLPMIFILRRELGEIREIKQNS